MYSVSLQGTSFTYFPYNPSVIIHSDQGSQYLSTTFKQILEDDGFLQSVSARGNSQDNAPVESFFSRMKTAVLDLVALCRNFEQSEQLIEGYINSYNNEIYQLDLAGLTPHEFYLYCQTGIYPCDNYFGVKATKMRSLSAFSSSACISFQLISENCQTPVLDKGSSLQMGTFCAKTHNSNPFRFEYNKVEFMCWNHKIGRLLFSEEYTDYSRVRYL